MPYGPSAAQRPAQRVSAADVRAVRFGKPPFGKRGYDETEVDDFLRHVADTLALVPQGVVVSPTQVHEVAFRKPRLGSRGYDEDEVDAFLDLVEGELRWRETPDGQRELAAQAAAAAGGGAGGGPRGGAAEHAPDRLRLRRPPDLGHARSRSRPDRPRRPRPRSARRRCRRRQA